VHVEASSDSLLACGADTIAVGFFKHHQEVFDDPTSGALQQLIDSGEARPRLGHVTVTHARGQRFVVAGLGERDRFGPEQARVAAAAVDARVRELSTQSLAWELPAGFGPEIAAALVQGTLLHAYQFDRYLHPRERLKLERVLIRSDEDLSAAVRRAVIVTEAQNRARDLGNTPGNDLPPAALAGYARELASRTKGVELDVLDGPQIRESGMGAFTAVAQGSVQEPRLIKLTYEGPGSGDAPRLGLIGKAITFDSGGISLKSNQSMHEMKFDMAGGAAVIEAIGALAELRAPVRVLGIVGAAENLPGGAAVKPGDIVRALDGTTIEVENTDAEGRLVLADCLCYARSLGAERLVDIATLTGAIVTALGSNRAGLMSNDDAWAKLVEESGERSGERVWRLPLGEEYAQMVKGRYAQLTNRAERREAQAITAAELLHHFAGEVPWAHLDIAGTAWDVPRPYLRGKGASGFGVRLLVELALTASG
jgi:leucyl aminopeptidase